MTRLGNRILFGGETLDTENELWRTNGTEAGTVLVKRIAPPDSFVGSYPHELTKVGNRVYFTPNNTGNPFDPNNELWRTDSSTTGTKLVKDINPSGGSGPMKLINVAGTLYFTADDGAHGRELWRYVP